VNELLTPFSILGGLKLRKLDRAADPYIEKDILDELDESDLFDIQGDDSDA